MRPTSNVAVYALEPRHATALDALAAAAPAEQHVLLDGVRKLGGRAFAAAAAASRDAGDQHTFAVEESGVTIGVCALRRPPAGLPRAEVWIAPAVRRRGLGTFALTKVLELAFDNLQVPRLAAAAVDEAARRLLARAAFTAPASGDPIDAQEHTVAAPAWRAQRHADALARLAPPLRTLLDAELAAGNEVAETGSGWPDADSVFVRLKRPFVVTPAALPPDVTYARLDDPHWWRAEYTTRSPCHLLVF
jgi:RimJ/RimL family protein N-acetyltransferase